MKNVRLFPSGSCPSILSVIKIIQNDEVKKENYENPRRRNQTCIEKCVFLRQTFTESESRRVEFSETNEIKTDLTFQSKLTFPSKNPRLIVQK